LEALDRSEDVLLLCVGDWTIDAVAANETTPIRIVGCSAMNARRFLRRHHSIGLDVGSAHAARHVHRENNVSCCDAA
jgi:hypothetical protein